jgi:hypothetical protein
MRPIVVAAVVGLSMSIATPEVAAGAASETAVVTSTIGGLATGKPRLRLAIETQAGFPVTAVTVAPPSGLAFSEKAADRDHGVRVGTDTPATSVRKGELIVKPPRASTSFTLTIASPAMTESAGLERAIRKLIRFNESHLDNERALPLTFSLTLDSGRHAAIKVLATIAFR